VAACLVVLGCTSSSGTGGSQDGGDSSSGQHSSSGSSSGSGDATTDGGGGSPTDSGVDDSAVGAGSLDAQQAGDACQASIAVTVLDPTGRYPIPNAYVFIRDGLPAPIEGGLGPCPSIPAAGAGRTGFDGSATLNESPSGTVTVEALIGKWGTTQSVSVPACGKAAATLKLPRDASHGSVPAIAVSTGNGDTLECTLHRMGIDGAVTFFQGSGGAKATGAMPSTTLWASASALSAFDAVLLSCEGEETVGAMPSNLAAYATAGGHVFAEHFQYAWFNAAPFSTQSIATWSPGTNLFASTVSADPSRSLDGLGLAQWLPARGALTNGELPMTNMQSAHNATLGSAAVLTLSTDSTSSVPNAPLLFSWSEGASGGSIVYADFHVGSASGDYGTTPGTPVVPPSASFPSGCQTAADLTPSELVFLYTLFDDLSCDNGSIMR
jgi:hypothetical protein